MGRADFLREGDFNRICDRCGFKWKASDTVKDWQGRIVCPQCYEGRHPQDFVRGTRDRQRVPWSRPQKTPNFIGSTFFFGGMDFTIAPGISPAALKIDKNVAASVSFSPDISGTVSANSNVDVSVSFSPDISGAVAFAANIAPSVSVAFDPTATVSATFNITGAISHSYDVVADVTVAPSGAYEDESGDLYVDESGNNYVDGT